MQLRMVSALGLVILIALAWALSEKRSRIGWRLVVMGLALQFAIGIVLLIVPVIRDTVFAGMGGVVNLLTDSTRAGAKVIFGQLADSVEIPTGGGPGSEGGVFTLAAPFAFTVLPVIIFVSALAAILHHLHVIQFFVGATSWLMRRSLRTSGAETLGAALLIFLGIEAVSAIRGYLARMTRSELCTIMTTFMATIAGSVMIIYATFGAEPGHLLIASLMSAPAAILFAKMLVPETEQPETSGDQRVHVQIDSFNVIDAAAQGTATGLNMALSVGAMVIVFVALIHMLNLFLSWGIGVTFTDLMAYAFYPFALVMGVPKADAWTVAQLLGTKSVINEFVAYLDLQAAIQAGALSPRSITIATYALCGFANPGSIGIAIAGLDALIPERRREVTGLAWKSFVGGTLACFATACVAGILVDA